MFLAGERRGVLLRKFNCNNSFWLNLHAFAPKLQFRVNRPVEDPIVAFSVKGGYWRMMADLFAQDFKLLPF